MPHDPQKYLHDALNSCEFLIEFTAGRTLDDYTGDRAFRSAVERELQIIGEAILQLDRVAPQVAARIPEHRSIIGFRHVLVHGYASLQPTTVWSVVAVKLDGLARALRELLSEFPPPPTTANDNP